MSYLEYPLKGGGVDRHPWQGDTRPSTLLSASFLLGVSDVLKSLRNPWHITNPYKADLYLEDTGGPLKMEDGGCLHIK